MFGRAQTVVLRGETQDNASGQAKGTMAMIAFSCTCGKQFRVEDELAGKRAKCSCGKTLVIPQPAAVAMQTSAQPVAVAVLSTVPAPFEKNFPPHQISKRWRWVAGIGAALAIVVVLAALFVTRDGQPSGLEPSAERLAQTAGQQRKEADVGATKESLGPPQPNPTGDDAGTQGDLFGNVFEKLRSAGLLRKEIDVDKLQRVLMEMSVSGVGRIAFPFDTGTTEQTHVPNWSVGTVDDEALSDCPIGQFARDTLIRQGCYPVWANRTITLREIGDVVGKPESESSVHGFIVTDQITGKRGQEPSHTRMSYQRGLFILVLEDGGTERWPFEFQVDLSHLPQFHQNLKTAVIGTWMMDQDKFRQLIRDCPVTRNLTKQRRDGLITASNSAAFSAELDANGTGELSWDRVGFFDSDTGRAHGNWEIEKVINPAGPGISFDGEIKGGSRFITHLWAYGQYLYVGMGFDEPPMPMIRMQ